MRWVMPLIFACGLLVYAYANASDDHMAGRPTGMAHSAQLTSPPGAGSNNTAPPVALRVTAGTDRKSNLRVVRKTDTQSSAVRFNCMISHFSYDDPVVFPDQPGRSHLHMFFGNTNVGAYTKSRDLLENRVSTCDGGYNARSSYWVPALFNGLGNVVLPEYILIYYKAKNPNAIENKAVSAVPNGLAFLAGKTAKNYQKGRIKFKDNFPEKGLMQTVISFPRCLKVDGSGKPYLRSSDLPSAFGKSAAINAHVAYRGGQNRDPITKCPEGFPYLIPSLEYILVFRMSDIYARDETGKLLPWYLASDDKGAVMSGAEESGHSAHADYIVMWEPPSENSRGPMADIIACLSTIGTSCNFGGQQVLPERFLAPDGTPIYHDRNELFEVVDRQPIDLRAMTQMHHGDMK